MDSLNDMFFRSTASENLTYDQILEDVQKYCTEKHADKLSTEGNQEEARKLLREFIFQYVSSRSYAIENMSTEELCDSLYEDMAGISFLKKWIYKPGIEEVNINSYDDIEVIMSGGRSIKIPDKFQSPQHAIDVTRRLLNTCGMVIDDTMPSVIGFLDKNIRISVDKSPIVDADVGINASIRIVNQQTVSKEKLMESGSATEEMLDLLTCCIRYGVSVCIAGSTGSGKTTVMSWLLSMVPNNRRLITIEEGSREFDLIKRDENGHAINSVVHLLTRPHENPSLDIDQDLLLERVLRKHPDVIGVGEMRSAKEALSVAESSRTGHTVVTTIHSNSSESTYRRMMTLAKRKYNMADDILMQIMVEAYPIVVFTKQLEDGSRKIMQIIEGEDYRNGKLYYKTLYQYDVKDNQKAEDGSIRVIGKHRRLSGISETLKKRMLDNGIPVKKLSKFYPIAAFDRPPKEVQKNALD
ncbi:MAG: CpaF family protein [Roseburia sp.]|nr:CpaF family protein [Roseburia sp.]